MLRLGSAILVGILLVYFGFSQEEIGDFEYFLFLANGLSFFWSIGLLNGMKSYFPSIVPEKQKTLLFGTAVLFILFAATSFGLIGLYSAVFGKVWSFPLILLALYLVLAMPSSLSEHILILKDRSKSIFWYGCLSYSMYFIGIAAIVFVGGGVSDLLLFLVAWSALRFLVLIFLLRAYTSWRFDTKQLLSFFVFCMPLFVHVLLGSGMEYVDGFLVDYFFDRSDFAMFRYGARELPISTVLISAMVSTMIPLAVVQLDESLTAVRGRLTNIMHWLFPISAALMLVSKPLFIYLYGIDFAASSVVFNIYLLILCSRVLLPQVILYARHENTALMIAAFVELVVNITLSLIFLSSYGIYGIAAATVVAYLVQKTILILIVRTRHNISLGSYINLTLYTTYAVGLYVVFAFSIWLYA